MNANILPQTLGSLPKTVDKSICSFNIIPLGIDDGSSIISNVQNMTADLATGPDSIPAELSVVTLRSLAPSTRHRLSVFLDPPSESLTDTGLIPDATGLAELAGLDAATIRYIVNKDNTTERLLDIWKLQKNGTIGHLVDYLGQLQRIDVLVEIRDKLGKLKYMNSILVI